VTTIKDIAARARVSPSTVSRYLNGQIKVREDTRQRIEAAVESLGYKPNFLARSLVLKETQTVAIVIADILNPYFAGVARGFEDVAQSEGLSVYLCNSDNKLEKEERYLQWLQYKHVDGIALVSTGQSAEYLTDFMSRGTDLIIAGRRVPGVQADAISVANTQGAYEVTRHLLSLGYRRIGAVNVSKHLSTSAERMEGFRIALEEAGLEVDEELIADAVEYQYQAGYDATQRLIRLPNPPEAVFALSDLLAIGTINAIQEYGLSVPEDIAVVGFDGQQWGTWIRPRLTTIAVSPYDFGRQCAQMLIRRIASQGDEPYQDVIVRGKLVVRESCGCKIRQAC
jgi:LacI family transcriptional regulator